ncbi:PPE family protein, partial [Mycobacterium tuberculosis]
MTEPWIAFPPEVHSAMLNYGAGVGPMLISATQNGELSAQYAEAASEVEELLGVVASEGWQGQAAEAFVAAYMPFLAWLIQASADCVEMAAQQHVVIEAYTAAVELMPTQVELAANQIKLAVLVATNFFGINTIPIAINEAEYVEMWVRAATTMATYSTVSRSALSAMPHTSPPPLILKSDELLPDTGEDSDEDGHNHGGHSHGGHARMIDNFFAEILRGVSAGRIVWDPVNGTLNGLDYDDYVYPGHAIWWLARGLEFFQDGEQFGELLFTNPTGAFQFLLYVVVVDLPTHIAQIATWLGQYPQLLSAALTGVIAHLGAITGLAGLSGLSAIPSAAIPAVVPELTPVAAAPPMLAG